MRPDTAFFDMSTNSVATVRKIHAAFAEKNLYMLDSPVSGGPSGAASGKMAIWVGGDEQIRSEEHTSELQSHLNLVCRLLLEKKNKRSPQPVHRSPHPDTNSLDLTP